MVRLRQAVATGLLHNRPLARTRSTDRSTTSRYLHPPKLNDICKREDDLFRRWRQKRPNLVRDGAISELAYTGSSPRVVLVLKEVNSEYGGWDLRQELVLDPKWQTWNAVTRWMRGIRQLHRSLTWPEIEAKPDATERVGALRSICVVNLKKEAGGPEASRASVARFAREDADFLREQLALYDPDVIICGGVGPLVNELMNLGPWARTSKGLEFVRRGKTDILNFYHPQARYPLEMLYFSLIDGLRELRGHS